MHTPAADEKETGRVEAFSDGVFAIAITLLILEIRVPLGSMDEKLLRDELLHSWPSFVAYFSSFATIGIMWLNHHRMFTMIRKTDQRLMILNLLLLLGVTFVPFPTALLAEHFHMPIAPIIYSGSFFLIAMFFNVLWRYASHQHRLIHHSIDAASVAALTRQYSVGPVLYLACFVLAFFSVMASVGLNIALAIYFALEPEKANVLRQRITHHRGES